MFSTLHMVHMALKYNQSFRYATSLNIKILQVLEKFVLALRKNVLSLIYTLYSSRCDMRKVVI